jgi:hypothetical protein
MVFFASIRYLASLCFNSYGGLKKARRLVRSFSI